MSRSSPAILVFNRRERHWRTQAKSKTGFRWRAVERGVTVEECRYLRNPSADWGWCGWSWDLIEPRIGATAARGARNTQRGPRTTAWVVAARVSVQGWSSSRCSRSCCGGTPPSSRTPRRGRRRRAGPWHPALARLKTPRRWRGGPWHPALARLRRGEQSPSPSPSPWTWRYAGATVRVDDSGSPGGGWRRFFFFLSLPFIYNRGFYMYIIIKIQRI